MFLVNMMMIVTSPIFWIQTGYLHLEILVKKIPMEGNSHNTWPFTLLEYKKANVLPTFQMEVYYGSLVPYIDPLIASSL